MLQILVLVIALALAAGMCLWIIEKWEELKQRLISRALISLLILISLALGIRYWIISAVGCIPECVGSVLVGRDFGEMDLDNATFVAANLTGANFRRASMRGADFSGATLILADFEGADLEGAIFAGANLERANLAGTNLLDTSFNGADLDGADLTAVDLTQTSLLGVNLSGAELESVDLTQAELVAVDLTNAKMNGIKLNNANLGGASMSGANLSGAKLSGANLSGAWLNLATLAGADLSNADLLGVSFIGAELASTNLGGSRMVGSTLIAADLSGSNLNRTNLLGSRLLLSELTDKDLVSDSALESLNELQLSLLLTDAKLEGTTSNGQTTWPNPEVASAMEVVNIADEADEIDIENAIKVGILHSLSGPMAISESAVRDSTLLAIDEINAAGGLLDKQIYAIIEDGSSNPEAFAEKARKLIEEDEVVAIFGGWTSDSRKAILPVVEEFNNLLFYPVPSEGFEQSPNIFYLGAEPTQQIIPGAEYLLEQGKQRILLIGSDYIFPRIANAILKIFFEDAGADVIGEIYVPLGETDFETVIGGISGAPPDVIFNTLSGESNVAFFQNLAEVGLTPQGIPVMSASVAEEEVRLIGADFLEGHLTAWNYYQTVETPENFGFLTAYRDAYGDDRVTSDSIEAGYVGPYLWKALVEAAQSTETDAILSVAESQEIELLAPGGPVKLDGETHHLYKTVRIGVVREDGLIDTVFESDGLVKPDPFLTQYEWAEVLPEIVERLQEKSEQQ